MDWDVGSAEVVEVGREVCEDEGCGKRDCREDAERG